MRVKCLKCGTIIKSYTRHDFKWCPCENIFVDGGDDYLRFGGPGMEDKSYFVMERMEITIELTENGFSLPIQGDVENIASLTDSDERQIYHEPVKLGNGVELVWNEDIKAWELKHVKLAKPVEPAKPAKLAWNECMKTWELKGE